MKYYLLCSGSKGNCFVLLDEDVQLVIDCGNTKRYLLEAFLKKGLDYKRSDALLLTHSHTDHISQLKMFASVETYSPFEVEDREVHKVIPYEPFQIAHLHILPLVLSHDAPITVGYVIENKTEKLVYITDTGYLKQTYYDIIRNADYYIMESNHDVQMLMKSNRPYSLKQRILSDSGHLSNDTCAEILKTVIGEKTKEIILAHLSEEANTPELALAATKSRIPDERIRILCGNQREAVEGGSRQ